MTTEWLAILRETARTIGRSAYDAFLLPADLLIAYLRSFAPGGLIPVQADDAILRIGIAVVFWVIAVALAWKLVGLLKSALRTSDAMIRTACHALASTARGLKTRIVCALRPGFLRRRSAHIAPALEVKFNPLDLAVLRVGASLPPGFTLSAPELAARLMLRPAQVQRSLDRLRGYRLIECALGSVEGYDTYRLSPTAISMQEAWSKHSPEPAAASRRNTLASGQRIPPVVSPRRSPDFRL